MRSQKCGKGWPAACASSSIGTALTGSAVCANAVAGNKSAQHNGRLRHSVARQEDDNADMVDSDSGRHAMPATLLGTSAAGLVQRGVD
jgi:hypothetical protein